MPGNRLTGLKLCATDEARWLAEQIVTGKMAVTDACDLLAIPDPVRLVWIEAAGSDYELGAALLEALTFRRLVAEKFDLLLAEPMRHAPTRVKAVQRSGKRQARLPVARENAIPATQAAQEPCAEIVSL